MLYTWIDADTRLAATVVAIGNFDGVHRGHQAVLAHVCDEARARGAESALLTFDPHPALALGRTPPPMLTTLERKSSLVLELGVGRVLVRRFDAELSSWSPDRFAKELLCETLGVKLVAIGDNFRYGHKRAGTLATLREAGRELGFEVKAFAPVGDAAGPYSSTRVRDAVARGDVVAAAAVLGRPHSIQGVVEQGAQRGRTLGFPTANLGSIAEMVPGPGVYAVRVELPDSSAGIAQMPDGRLVAGVMNVGVRPTVDGVTPSHEVHLLDYSGDLYGETLRTHFIERIREERKFGGLPELQAQIARDVATARAIFR